MRPAPPVDYSPTPPTDRARVERQPDGSLLTLPPHRSWRFARYVALYAVFGLFSLTGVFVPAGRWESGRMSFEVGPAYGIPGRIIALLMFAWMIGRLVGLLTESRSWTTIGARNGVLTVTVPRRTGHRTREFNLADYTNVRPEGDEGDREDCYLVKPDKTREPIFATVAIRRCDLELAMTLIREAIARARAANTTGPDQSPAHSDRAASDLRS